MKNLPLLKHLLRFKQRHLLNTYGSNPNNWPKHKLHHLKHLLAAARKNKETIQLLKKEAALDKSLTNLTHNDPTPPIPQHLKAKIMQNAAPILQNYKSPLPSENLFHEIFLKNIRISIASACVAGLFFLGFIYGKSFLQPTYPPTTQIIQANNNAPSFAISTEDLSFFINSGNPDIESAVFIQE